MNIVFYTLVFIASFLVDVIPFIGPPAWTVMVFLQLKFDLNIWTVLLVGVAGSALGRYTYSAYIKRLSVKYLKEQKTADMAFIGSRLTGKKWKVLLFVLLYTLMPVPTTPLFTASGVAGIRPLHIMPAFFTGKFASDALMIATGNYVAKNLSALSHGLLGWHTLLGTGLGLVLICLFFFIDWQTLIIKKRLRLSFQIWK